MAFGAIETRQSSIPSAQRTMLWVSSIVCVRNTVNSASNTDTQLVGTALERATFSMVRFATLSDIHYVNSRC